MRRTYMIPSHVPNYTMGQLHILTGVKLGSPSRILPGWVLVLANESILSLSKPRPHIRPVVVIDALSKACSRTPASPISGPSGWQRRTI